MVVMVWHLARMLAQFTWVILLARTLGAPGYGKFSGIAGLALALSGFAGFGLGLRMYQDVARDPAQFSLRWRQASRVLAWSGVLLAAIFIVIARSAFDRVDWSLLAAIAVSELMLAPVVTLVAFAYGARGWMGLSAAAPVVLSVTRVLAVLALPLLTSKPDLLAYAWLHVVATASATAWLFIRCRRRMGMELEATEATIGWDDMRSGLGFSAIWASGMALSSMDKAFALRWGGDAIAGQYSAAYRFIAVAALPVDSLMMAVMPRLFRAGGGEEKAPRMFAVLIAVIGGYGIVMGVAVWLSSGLVPRLLGASFEDASHAVRMLAFYVPLYCMRLLGGNVLLGFGWKRWKFCSEILALGLMAAMAAWRIPAAGLIGAVEAMLVTEAVLVVLIWSRMLWRQKHHAQAVKK